MNGRPFGVIVGRGRVEVPVSAGWRTTTLADLPDEPFDLADRRLVVAASVTDADSARATLVAAARGCAVVVDITMDHEATAEFIEDLGRIVDLAAPSERVPLDGDQLMLLERLATGVTLVDAARQLGLSRRTATRRLADARRRLGTTSTTTAVRVFRAT